MMNTIISSISIHGIIISGSVGIITIIIISWLNLWEEFGHSSQQRLRSSFHISHYKPFDSWSPKNLAFS